MTSKALRSHRAIIMLPYRANSICFSKVDSVSTLEKPGYETPTTNNKSGGNSEFEYNYLQYHNWHNCA